MIPSSCCVWPRGLGVAVKLVRTWCVRHGHLRFARLFRQQRRSSNAKSGCSCAEAGATTSHPTAQCRFTWRALRRQEAGFDDELRRRRLTGRGLVGKRRNKLPLNENFCSSDQHRKLRGTFCFFWTREKGNRLESSLNESKCEGAGRVS